MVNQNRGLLNPSAWRQPLVVLRHTSHRAKKQQKQPLRSCIVAILEAITRDGRAPNVAESAAVKVSLPLEIASDAFFGGMRRIQPISSGSGRRGEVGVPRLHGDDETAEIGTAGWPSTAGDVLDPTGHILGTGLGRWCRPRPRFWTWGPVGLPRHVSMRALAVDVFDVDGRVDQMGRPRYIPDAPCARTRSKRVRGTPKALFRPLGTPRARCGAILGSDIPRGMCPQQGSGPRSRGDRCATLRLRRATGWRRRELRPSTLQKGCLQPDCLSCFFEESVGLLFLPFYFIARRFCSGPHKKYGSKCIKMPKR